VSKDTRAVDQIYDGFVIFDNKLDHIPENALGKLHFREILIGEIKSLVKIHSNAFANQSGNLTILSIVGKNIISGPKPYSFYDLANSFPKLNSFSYLSNIGTLDENSLGKNLTHLNYISLRVDAIKGSPFSNMNNISTLVFSSGNLNHITNGALKIGSLGNKHDKYLTINLVDN
jgi:hypothetical protein